MLPKNKERLQKKGSQKVSKSIQRRRSIDIFGKMENEGWLNIISKFIFRNEKTKTGHNGHHI